MGLNKIKYTLLLFLSSITFYAQQIDYYLEDGYVVDGYDVVSYFTAPKPLKGKAKYSVIYDNVKFKFSSEKNVKLFKENPKKYIPQYGGYCAYAVATKKNKMDVDAEVFEIRDGKLYMFYNSWFGSKLDDWKEADTKALQDKGDKNWEKLKYKN